MKIGILGGTFNPIHNAHLDLAKYAREALHLDKLLFMVANIPPHKSIQYNIPASDRLAMTRLAAQSLNDPSYEASDWELLRTGPSYTVDTLRECHQKYPGAECFYLVGTDMLLDLPHWRDTENLFKLTTFLCVPRKQYTGSEQEAAQMLRSMGAKVILGHAQVPPYSSTQVRECLLDARPVSAFLPFPVERYVYEEGIYFPFPLRWMQEKCRAALKMNRYRHTMGVVREAVELSARCGVDGKAARVAALLHDCARQIEPSSLGHAAKSAELAQDYYGVTDPNILRAIRLHTTGGADMTMLDKIVYLADMIEPNRAYPGVDELRALASHDVNAAFLAAVKHTISYLETCGLPVHPNSYLALNNA